VGDSGGVGSEPGGAGEFEAFLEDVFVAALDEAGADGQAASEGGRVVELVTAVGEIAVSGADRGGWLGRGGGFAARGQCGDDGRGPALAKVRLLPGKVVGLAGRSGGGEAANDVTEVQEIASGHAEAGACEAGDPFGAVAEGMDVGNTHQHIKMTKYILEYLRHSDEGEPRARQVAGRRPGRSPIVRAWMLRRRRVGMRGSPPRAWVSSTVTPRTGV